MAVRSHITILFLVSELNRIERVAESLIALQLPVQLIHGDLHYDNVLVCESGVSGVLDFEFCAHDWRAMELAICLSKYIASHKSRIMLSLLVVHLVSSFRLSCFGFNLFLCADNRLA
jgi:aminoglycoside phosphotransferase (APT) family kinase protein